MLRQTNPHLRNQIEAAGEDFSAVPRLAFVAAINGCYGAIGQSCGEGRHTPATDLRQRPFGHRHRWVNDDFRMGDEEDFVQDQAARAGKVVCAEFLQ